MAEHEDASPTRGLWWKSFVLAWVLTRVVGLGFVVADVEPPTVVGFGLLLGAWAVTWVAWRRHVLGPAGAGTRRNTFLRSLQRTSAAFAATAVMMLPLVVALDNEVLDRTTIPAAPVVAAMVALGLLALLGAQLWVPKLRAEATDLPELFGQYRARLFVRFAWAELPTLAGFGAVVLLGGEAWVYGIGAIASLAVFALAWPTAARVEREQEQLRAKGSTVDLAGVLQSVATHAGG